MEVKRRITHHEDVVGMQRYLWYKEEKLCILVGYLV